MKALLLGALVAACMVLTDSSESPSTEVASSQVVYANPGDGILNMFFLVNKYGYPLETHSVKTADGYTLKLYRIPHGKKCKVADKNKKPILLMHGLLCSAYDFVIMGPSKSLAYLLADNCYDVWMGNNRGNSESLKHVNYTTSDKRFWDFTWHEMGKYDVPAIIDFILQKTNQSSMHYVGFSQGTTQFFIFNSLYPEYTEKIRSMHALAPIAYLKNIGNILLKLLSIVRDQVKFAADIIGLHDLGAASKLLNLIGMMLCGDANFKNTLVSEICFNVPFVIAGFDHSQLNRTLLPAFYGHTPAGASTKQILHFGQLIASGHFRQFDYGLFKNLEVYKSIAPPEYDLKKITAPIATYYSENDMLGSVKDYNNLVSKLPNVVNQYKVPYSKFNHLDFVWATDAKLLVYDKLLEVLSKFP